MLLVALICQMGVSSVVAETNDIKPVEHEVVEETVDEEPEENRRFFRKEMEDDEPRR